MPRSAKMLLCCALLLSGCNYGGAIMSKLEGPPVHKALYVPKWELMVVVVENYQRGSGARLNADQIAAFLCAELKLNKVAPVIYPGNVYDLRVKDPEKFHAMSIAGVGKALGAKQVLYVDLQASTVDGPVGGDSVKGTVTGRVKVVDAETGITRWPEESEGGYPFEYATPWLNHSPDVNDVAVQEKLNRSTADSIARLFYTWQEEE